MVATDGKGCLFVSDSRFAHEVPGGTRMEAGNGRPLRVGGP